MNRPKSYSVRFANSNIGPELDTAQQLRDVLPGIMKDKGIADRSGHYLPAVQMESEHYQVRNLVRTGRVWRGCFARLRDDAPHVINAENVEREIDLDAGDRILEKAFFLYYEDKDILVFMMSRSVGYLTRFAIYWSRMLDSTYVDFPVVMDQERLKEIMEGGVREIFFTYARTPGSPAHRPKWDQRAMDMLEPVHGAVGKFSLRAPRGMTLGGRIMDMINWASKGGDVQSARVRVIDDADPIDLFLAPIKVRIEVRLNGRYPDERAAIEALQEIYSEHAHRLPERPKR